MIQVASVMTVWTKLQPEYSANMWKEALNKRLGTKFCLDLFAVILLSCCNSIKCFPVPVINYYVFLYVYYHWIDAQVDPLIPAFGDG